MKKILVVDDEPDSIYMLRKILEEEGFEVIEALSGKECLGKIKKVEPDLVLLDVRMPEMDGFKVCRRIKQSEKTSHIPVIFLTARYKNARSMAAGLDIGAVDYITSPFEKRELLARVKVALRTRELMDEVERDVAERKRAEEELKKHRAHLEELVEERTAKLRQEITKRKRAEEKIKASEKRYRRLFESAKDGILILDAYSGKIVDVNPFLCDLLGYSPDKILEKAFWEISPFKGIVSNKKKFKELGTKKYVRYEDLPLETEDGKEAHVEFVSNLYKVDHEQVIQCNIRDITNRKRAEEELKKYRTHLEELVEARTATLQQEIIERKKAEEALKASYEKIEDAYAELKELDSMKDEFLSNVSHELKTPLTSAKAGIEILLDKKPSEEGHEILTVCWDNIKRLDRLISEILELTRAKNGRAHVKMGSVDIGEMIGNSVHEIGPMAEVTGVNIQAAIEENLPHVVGNEEKLERAVFNLLSNAIKFNEKGGKVTVTARSEGDGVGVSVTDSGIGIPKKEQKKIFARFYQADGSLTRRYPGAGMGLTIAQAILNEHGSRIDVESAPGEGSSFSFTLPRENSSELGTAGK